MAVLDVSSGIRPSRQNFGSRKLAIQLCQHNRCCASSPSLGTTADLDDWAWDTVLGYVVDCEAAHWMCITLAHLVVLVCGV